MSEIINGDCIEVMASMQENSVDAIVTDPPYGLGFMGKGWDKVLPPKEWLEQAMRIMKPGASIMVMGGTRTFHRMAVMMEDAGFIIKDTLCYLYGSGFPKAQDLGKMIDKRAGAERTIEKQIRVKGGGTEYLNRSNKHTHEYRPGDYQKGENILDITSPFSDLAKHWDGFKIGGIKPAWEPIIWAVKPPEGAWIDNVLKWGVGAVNVDECRVGTGDRRMCGATDKSGETSYILGAREETRTEQGRFPANVIHDGSDEVVGLFPETKSGGANGRRKNGPYSDDRTWSVSETPGVNITDGLPPDSGSASRFFYCAKASRSERNAGCENLPEAHKKIYSGGIVSSDHPGIADGGGERKSKNNHPTVKPIALMGYIIKLVTRSGQVVLDPFCGSGSTGCAASKCGREFIGIEKESAYCEIAERRMGAIERKPDSGPEPSQPQLF